MGGAYRCALDRLAGALVDEPVAAPLSDAEDWAFTLLMGLVFGEGTLDIFQYRYCGHKMEQT